MTDRGQPMPRAMQVTIELHDDGRWTAIRRALAIAASALLLAGGAAVLADSAGGRPHPALVGAPLPAGYPPACVHSSQPQVMFGYRPPASSWPATRMHCPPQ
jgi:hypothetical protein